jgi:hypothetical protein
LVTVERWAEGIKAVGEDGTGRGVIVLSVEMGWFIEEQGWVKGRYRAGPGRAGPENRNSISPGLPSEGLSCHITQDLAAEGLGRRQAAAWVVVYA